MHYNINYLLRTITNYIIKKLTIHVNIKEIINYLILIIHFNKKLNIENFQNLFLTLICKLFAAFVK